MRMSGQRHTPAYVPRGKIRYPFYRRLVGSQGRYRRVWKISHPLGFNPRTAQPVVTRYTDYIIPAHDWWKINIKLTHYKTRCSDGVCPALESAADIHSSENPTPPKHVRLSAPVTKLPTTRINLQLAGDFVNSVSIWFQYKIIQAASGSHTEL